MASRLVVCLLLGSVLLVGCSSDTKKKAAKKKNSPVDNSVDWQSELKKWKSADGTGRLAMIEGRSPYQLMALEELYKGKTADELKAVFGEPDAREGRRKLSDGKETYVYHLGTTTKDTDYKTQSKLYWEFNKEGKIGDMSVKLNFNKK